MQTSNVWRHKQFQPQNNRLTVKRNCQTWRLENLAEKVPNIRILLDLCRIKEINNISNIHIKFQDLTSKKFFKMAIFNFLRWKFYFHHKDHKACLVDYLDGLCWFQTSLPLAALPLCRVIIACCFRVAALSGNAALALSPSGIAPELNRIQLSAICSGGQSGKVIDLLAWRCLPLGHPSAASGACAVEQIYHQSSNAASGKLVWNQH